MDMKNQIYPKAMDYPSAPTEEAMPVAQEVPVYEDNQRPEPYMQQSSQPYVSGQHTRTPYAPSSLYTGSNYGTMEILYRKPQTPKSSKLLSLCTLADPYYYKCILYHGLNLVIGFCAMTLLSFGVPFGFTLIPFCCVGLLVLRILHLLIVWLIKLEIRVYNLMVSRNKRILINEPMPLTSSGHERFALSKDIEQGFSLKSVVALVYYGFVKFPMSILFSTVTLVTFILSIFSVLGVASSVAYLFVDCVPLNIYVLNMHYRQWKKYDQQCMDSREALVFFVGALLIMVAAKWIMGFMTRLSMRLTRYCCAEKVQTFMNVYVPMAQVVDYY